MGRARQQQLAVTVASQRFQAVLGGHRGSVVAQAQRDATEIADHEALVQTQLKEFLDGIRFGATTVSGLAELLTTGYRLRDQEENVTEMIARLRTFERFQLMRPLREAAFIIYRGDPLLCPGLTEPMVLALCQYLSETIAEYPNVAKSYGEIMINHLFLPGRSESYYQRLEPLSQVVASLIADSSLEGSGLGKVAADALRVAPQASLLGPLRSWIDAFVSRINQQLITREEMRELEAGVLGYGIDAEAAPALDALNRAHERYLAGKHATWKRPS